MMKFVDALKGTTSGIIYGVSEVVRVNAGYVANGLLLVLPYVMYYIGLTSSDDPINKFLLIPPIFLILWYYIKEVSNRINRRNTFPIPDKRFTKVDEDGEVSVERGRLQEMILYVGDVEDWLSRKGIL